MGTDLLDRIFNTLEKIQEKQTEILEILAKTDERLKTGSNRMDSLDQRINDLESKHSACTINNNNFNEVLVWFKTYQSKLDLIIKDYDSKMNNKTKVKDQFLINSIKWVFGALLLILGSGVFSALPKIFAWLSTKP